MRSAWFGSLLLLANGFDLECRFEEPTGDGRLTGKTCDAQNVEIIAPNETITSVNGQADFVGHDVSMLLIKYQTVNYFPKGLEKFFPELTGISITFSRLQSIEKSDLEPFIKLRILYLSSNDIEVLLDDVFEFNTELRAIFFKRNQLKFIGKNVLSNLPKLDNANFSFNKCIDQVALTTGAVYSLSRLFKERCSNEECQRKNSALKEQVSSLKLRLKSLESKSLDQPWSGINDEV